MNRGAKSQAQMFCDFAPWAVTLDRNDNVIPGYFTLMNGEVYSMHYNPFKKRSVPLEWCRMLPHLPHLQTVKLDGSLIDAERLAAMTGLEALEYLAIDLGDLPDEAYVPFASFVNLARLAIRLPTTRALAGCLRQLQRCGALANLSVYTNATFNSSACKELGKCTQVRELSIPRGSLSGEFPFSTLRAHRIFLSTVECTDLQMTQIGQSCASEIFIGRTSVGDETASRLQNCTSLRTLDIASTRVTAVGLRALSSLPISDLCYSHLTDLLTAEEATVLGEFSKLQRLEVRLASEDQRQMLSRVLPNCQIEEQLF